MAFRVIPIETARAGAWRAGFGKDARPARARAGASSNPVRYLPSLPDALSRLAHIADDPRVGSVAFLETLRGDLALGQGTLDALNGAFFPPLRPAGHLAEAVREIGLRSAWATAFLVGVGMRVLPHGPAAQGWDRAGFWRHSVATAVAAEQLAREIGAALPQTAFVAGLLHDVGWMILDRFDGPALARVVAALEAGEALPDAERRVLDASHVDLGGRAARVWGLPRVVGEAIVAHHGGLDRNDDAAEIAALVRVADAMTSDPEGALWNSDLQIGVGAILEAWGIERSALERSQRQAVARMEALEELLKLDAGALIPTLAALEEDEDGEVV